MAKISFENFQAKAAEIIQAQQADTQAIGLGTEGKLGSYTIKPQQLTSEDKQRFAAVKNELTAALTQKFSVDSIEKLPASVRTTLGNINKSERLMAKDIQLLADDIKAELETREAVKAALFEKGAAVGEAITAHLTVLVGEGASIPLRSPISKLLNDTYSAFMESLDGRTASDLLANQESLGRELESLLQAIVTEAFGANGTEGPLAQALAKAMTDTAGQEAVIRESACDAVFMDYVPEGGKASEPPPETLGTLTIPNTESSSSAEPLFAGALEQPKAVADEKSAKRSDILKEADSAKAWFEAQLRELSGDQSFNLKLPKKSSAIANLLAFTQAAATVGDFRAMARAFFAVYFTQTTNDQPVSLAETLREACAGRSSGAKRLIVLDAVMHDGITRGGKQEFAALDATVRLALDDFAVRQNLNKPYEQEMAGDDFIYEASDVAEPLAWSSETREHIIFIAEKAVKENNLEVLRNLVDALKADDPAKVEVQAQKLNYVHKLTPYELGQTLTNYRGNDILVALNACHSELVWNDDFRLYLGQCLGEKPVEIKGGNEIYREGGWEARPDYVRAIHSAIQRSGVEASGVPLIKTEVSVPNTQSKSLNDFRAAFNLTRKGAFSTPVCKTKGQLYLDKNGRLQNANRHFGSTVPSTGAENWRVRAELLDAFRKAGADEKFLTRVTRDLNLNNEGRTQPLSRQIVKQLLMAFDPSLRAVPAKKVEATHEAPKQTTLSAPAWAPKDVAVPHGDAKNSAQQPLALVKRLAALPVPQGTQYASRLMPYAQLAAQALVVAKAGGRTEPATFDYLVACSQFKLDPADFSKEDAPDVQRFNLRYGRDTLPRGFAKAFSLALCDAFQNPGWGLDISDLLEELNQALDDGSAASRNGSDPEAALNAMAARLADKVVGRQDANTIGKFKQALSDALVDMRLSKPIRKLYDEAVVQNGGGLIRSDSWSFAEGRGNYISNLVPQADINTEFKVDTSSRPLALTGLSRTELLDSNNNNAVLLRMLRFGEVGARNSLEGKLRPKEERAALYRNLVEQTFLANANLTTAQNGDTVVVPVVRLDLGGHELLSTPPADFTFTFTPPNENEPRTVTLRPQVAHFCLPNDTLKHDSEILLSQKEVELNKAAWAQLKAKAAAYQGAEGETVRMLSQQIDDYLSQVLPEPAQEVRGFPNFGAEMTRLGARIGVLTSLLGDVPSINCNWGRDRTGVMDNECKLVMHKIHTHQPLPSIRLEGADPDIALRTRMITKTGNWDLAHQVNDTIHNLNLHQFHGEFTVDRKKYKTSGLPSLFQERNIGVKPTGDLNIARAVLDRPKAVIKENAGGGSCFFYSAIHQIAGNAYTDSREGALKLRGELIAHARQRLAEMQQKGGLPGLYTVEGLVCVETSGGLQPVSDGVNLVNDPQFQTYGSYADISHGAFLADMLKRPVTIVTAETQASITFDRDLGTNQPLQGDPLVIFYNRGNDGMGHFRAVIEGV